MSYRAQASLERAHDRARLWGKDTMPPLVAALSKSEDLRCQRAAVRAQKCGSLQMLGVDSRGNGLRAHTLGLPCDQAWCQNSACRAHRARKTTKRLDATVAEYHRKIGADGKRMRARLVTLTMRRYQGRWDNPRQATDELSHAHARLRRPTSRTLRSEYCSRCGKPWAWRDAHPNEWAADPMADSPKEWAPTCSCGVAGESFWDHYVVGGMGVIECPTGPTGWGPHIHMVVVGRWVPYKRLLKAWADATGEEGLIVDVRAIKPNQRGDVDAVVHEVVKYVTKGTDLVLQEGAIESYVRTMKGARRHRWWGEWVGYHPERGQEEVGIATAPTADWLRVVDGEADHMVVQVSGTARALQERWGGKGELVAARTTGWMRPDALKSWSENTKKGRPYGPLALVLALAALPLSRCQVLLKVPEDAGQFAHMVVSDAWRRARQAERRAKARVREKFPNAVDPEVVHAALVLATEELPY